LAATIFSIRLIFFRNSVMMKLRDAASGDPQAGGKMVLGALQIGFVPFQAFGHGPNMHPGKKAFQPGGLP
jgi:hypothetical protein